jgi:hypothetical protein
VEDFGTGGKFESCSHAVESHLLIFERTIRDSRRMHRSLYFQPCPLSIVLCNPLDHFSRSPRKLRSGVCRAASQIDADKRRKTTRFNIDNDHNDDQTIGYNICGCDNGVRVGQCCSSFEDITSPLKSNITTTSMSNNDDDDGNDNETARRGTPSASSAIPEPLGKDSPQRRVHGAPETQCTVAMGPQTEDIWLSSRSPSTCRRSRIPPPAGTGNCAPKPDCSSRIIRG